MTIAFDERHDHDDFDCECQDCGWTGPSNSADLQDDMVGDWDGWETVCVCPKCGGDLERI